MWLNNSEVFEWKRRKFRRITDEQLFEKIHSNFFNVWDHWFYLNGRRPLVIVSIKHLGVVYCNLQCCRLILSAIGLDRSPSPGLLCSHWLEHLPGLTHSQVLLNTLCNISYLRPTIYNHRFMTIDIDPMGPNVSHCKTFFLYMFIFLTNSVFFLSHPFLIFCLSFVK